MADFQPYPECLSGLGSSWRMTKTSSGSRGTCTCPRVGSVGAASLTDTNSRGAWTSESNSEAILK